MNYHSFRVAFNGHVYRIEKRCWRGHLWWRRQVWKPLGRHLDLGDSPYVTTYYDSLVTAKAALAEAVQQEESKRAEWLPVLYPNGAVARFCYCP